jgi:hypothetical protein
MNVFSKVVFRPNPLVIDRFVIKLLDDYPNDLRPVQLVPCRPPGVIAQVIKELEMPWGEDELDPIFDRLSLHRRGSILANQIRLRRVVSFTKDTIPASGEWILAEGLRIHAESPPQQGFRIPKLPQIGGRSRRWTGDVTGPHPT